MSKKFQIVVTLMKEWREVQGLKNILYPEVLDSLIIMTLKELGNIEGGIIEALSSADFSISKIVALVIT